jgi:hypothetical protein
MSPIVSHNFVVVVTDRLESFLDRHERQRGALHALKVSYHIEILLRHT